MTVSYSTLLRLNVITTGTEDGQWGDLTNTNIGTLLEQAVAGSASIDVTSGNVTLSNSNGVTDQARNMIIRVIGTPGVSRNVVAPASSKMYIVANGSNASIVFKASASTGLTIPANEVYIVYYDTVLADFVYVSASGTSANVANKLVLRDGSGNFAAGAITATSFIGALDSSVTATTQSAGDNSTKVATTAYVATAITNATGTLGTMASQDANSIAVTGGNISGVRIAPRVLESTANSATPTLNTDDYDMMVITGQSVAITSFTTNLTGTPTNGQKLWIAITGTTSIAITWGASFESSTTTTLPTTTTGTSRLDVGFVWNTATSKWRCVAIA